MKHTIELSQKDIEQAIGDFVKARTGGNIVSVELDITAPFTCADQRENTYGSVDATVVYSPTEVHP
jgi:hypothetical protein